MVLYIRDPGRIDAQIGCENVNGSLESEVQENIVYFGFKACIYYL